MCLFITKMEMDNKTTTIMVNIQAALRKHTQNRLPSVRQPQEIVIVMMLFQIIL